MKKGLSKSIAVAVAGTVFITNVALVHATESNLWAERKQIRLASLPVALQPNLLPKATALSPLAPKIASRQTIQKRLPAGATAELIPIIKALPENAGSIRKIVASSRAAAPIVVHIQDIHRNLEAQANIARAVQSLADRNAVEVVALEGAFGPIDLSWGTAAKNPEAVKAVADYLFQANRISGPIYGALTGATSPQVIVGIDEKTHYTANVDAYRRSQKMSTSYTRKLQSTLKVLEAQKAQLFNADLRNFDAIVEKYRDGEVSFGTHVTSLAEHVNDVSPKLEAFLATLELEKKLDFSRVEEERARLIAALVATLNGKETQNLLDHSAAYRAGELGHSDFYSLIKDLCSQKGIELAAYPSMGRYLQYVLLADSLDIDAVLKEVSILEQKAYAGLVRTETERQLAERSRLVHLAEQLVGFSLTADSWKEYKAVSGLVNLDLDLRPFEAFYLEAEARDRAIAENLQTEMKRAKARVAVLVTGGFHSNGIAQQLKSAGITVVSYAPRVTKVDDESGSAYLSVFSRERTPLDQLFAGEKLFLAQAPSIPPAIGKAAVDKTDEIFAKGGSGARTEMALLPDQGATLEVTAVPESKKVTNIQATPSLRAVVTRLLGRRAFISKLGTAAAALISASTPSTARADFQYDPRSVSAKEMEYLKAVADVLFKYMDPEDQAVLNTREVLAIFRKENPYEVLRRAGEKSRNPQIRTVSLGYFDIGPDGRMHRFISIDPSVFANRGELVPILAAELLRLSGERRPEIVLRQLGKSATAKDLDLTLRNWALVSKLASDSEFQKGLPDVADRLKNEFIPKLEHLIRLQGGTVPTAIPQTKSGWTVKKLLAVVGIPVTLIAGLIAWMVRRSRNKNASLKSLILLPLLLGLGVPATSPLVSALNGQTVSLAYYYRLLQAQRDLASLNAGPSDISTPDGNFRIARESFQRGTSLAEDIFTVSDLRRIAGPSGEVGAFVGRTSVFRSPQQPITQMRLLSNSTVQFGPKTYFFGYPQYYSNGVTPPLFAEQVAENNDFHVLVERSRTGDTVTTRVRFFNKKNSESLIFLVDPVETDLTEPTFVKNVTFIPGGKIAVHTSRRPGVFPSDHFVVVDSNGRLLLQLVTPSRRNDFVIESVSAIGDYSVQINFWAVESWDPASNAVAYSAQLSQMFTYREPSDGPAFAYPTFDTRVGNSYFVHDDHVVAYFNRDSGDFYEINYKAGVLHFRPGAKGQPEEWLPFTRRDSWIVRSREVLTAVNRAILVAPTENDATNLRGIATILNEESPIYFSSDGQIRVERSVEHREGGIPVDILVAVDQKSGREIGSLQMLRTGNQPAPTFSDFTANTFRFGNKYFFVNPVMLAEWVGTSPDGKVFAVLERNFIGTSFLRNPIVTSYLSLANPEGRIGTRVGIGNTYLGSPDTVEVEKVVFEASGNVGFLVANPFQPVYDEKGNPSTLNDFIVFNRSGGSVFQWKATGGNGQIQGPVVLGSNSVAISYRPISQSSPGGSRYLLEPTTAVYTFSANRPSAFIQQIVPALIAASVAVLGFANMAAKSAESLSSMEATLIIGGIVAVVFVAFGLKAIGKSWKRLGRPLQAMLALALPGVARTVAQVAPGVNPPFTTLSGLQSKTTIDYAKVNRQPDGKVSYLAVNDPPNISGIPAASEQYFVYGPQGLLRKTVNGYDVRGYFFEETEYGYDAAGNLVGQITDFHTRGNRFPTTVRTATTHFNQNGRRIGFQSIDSNGTETFGTYEFYPDGRPKMLRIQTKLSYDTAPKEERDQYVLYSYPAPDLVVEQFYDESHYVTTSAANLGPIARVAMATGLKPNRERILRTTRDPLVKIPVRSAHRYFIAASQLNEVVYVTNHIDTYVNSVSGSALYEKGRLVSIDYPSIDRQWVYSYNDLGHLVGVDEYLTSNAIVPPGRLSSRQYQRGVNGRLEGETSAENLNYIYSELQNRKTIRYDYANGFIAGYTGTDGRGNRITGSYVYAPNSATVTEIVHQIQLAGQSTPDPRLETIERFTYNDVDGTKEKRTYRQHENVTAREMADRNIPVEVTRFQLTGWTLVEIPIVKETYVLLTVDGTPTPIQLNRQTQNLSHRAAEIWQTQINYNQRFDTEKGRLMRLTRDEGSGVNDAFTFEYNDRGLVSRYNVERRQGERFLSQRVTTYEYDAMGNLVEENYNSAFGRGGETSKTVYTWENGRKVRFEKTTAGIDEKVIGTYLYDTLGRVQELTTRRAITGAGVSVYPAGYVEEITQFEYSADGKIVKKTVFQSSNKLTARQILNAGAVPNEVSLYEVFPGGVEVLLKTEINSFNYDGPRVQYSKTTYDYRETRTGSSVVEKLADITRAVTNSGLAPALMAGLMPALAVITAGLTMGAASQDSAFGLRAVLGAAAMAAIAKAIRDRLFRSSALQPLPADESRAIEKLARTITNSEAAESVLRDIRARAGQGSLNVADALRPQAHPMNSRVVNRFMIGLELLRKHPGGLYAPVTHLFKRLGGAMKEAFSQAPTTVTVVHVNTENDLKYLSAAATAARELNAAGNPNRTVVVGVVISQRSSHLVSQASAKIRELADNVPMAMVVEGNGKLRSEQGALAYGDLFSEFATAFDRAGQREGLRLFSELAKDDTSEKRVVIVGHSEIRYLASDRLLEILLNVTEVAKGFLLININAVMVAAKMA